MTKKIKRLLDNINITKLEIEQILMEKIKDRDNAGKYERLIEKRNGEIGMICEDNYEEISA